MENRGYRGDGGWITVLELKVHLFPAKELQVRWAKIYTFVCHQIKNPVKFFPVIQYINIFPSNVLFHRQ